MSREDELKEVLKEEQKESKVEESPEGKLKFKIGKKKWGFWIMVVAFIIFLILWYIVKPAVGG